MYIYAVCLTFPPFLRFLKEGGGGRGTWDRARSRSRRNPRGIIKELLIKYETWATERNFPRIFCQAVVSWRSQAARTSAGIKDPSSKAQQAIQINIYVSLFCSPNISFHLFPNIFFRLLSTPHDLDNSTTHIYSPPACPYHPSPLHLPARLRELRMLKRKMLQLPVLIWRRCRHIWRYDLLPPLLCSCSSLASAARREMRWMEDGAGGKWEHLPRQEWWSEGKRGETGVINK